ncbi:MAG: hypothetical protein D0530_11935 [Methylococcales bacterium]|nr:MAG: hypothetical protein D0530_11935 [Methylococcales bacterium]
MSVRVHDLAKHCGISNKEMVAKLHAMNYSVKSHSSMVDNITAQTIEKAYGYPSELMEYYRVSRIVNSPGHNGADCIVPVSNS